MVNEKQRKRSDWRTTPRDEFWGRVLDEHGQQVKTKSGEPVYQHLGWVQYLVSQYPRGYDFRPALELKEFAAGHIHRSQDDLEWTGQFEGFIQAKTRLPYQTWRLAQEPQHTWDEVKAAIVRAERINPLAIRALEYYQGKWRGQLTREGFMQREHIASSRGLTEHMYRAAALVLDELERGRRLA